MILFVSFLFVFFLIHLISSNNTYKVLISLLLISFYSQFLVGRKYEYMSYFTFINSLFTFINLYLIMTPWSKVNIKIVEFSNTKYIFFFKRLLYFFLLVNLFLNFLILIVVFYFLPNIAEFKAELAYTKLYEQIPFFANIFRYSFTSQNLGYLAIPFFYYHLGKLQIKKAIFALLLSFSSLISGFAFYSRAQIFTYVLVIVCYFFLIKGSLPHKVVKNVSILIKRFSIIIFSFFILITYLRFSEMDYYGDRIPNSSIIKDPILYSIIDYGSQGFSIGLNQMEIFNNEKILNGEQIFRDIYQILNFFDIIHWDSDESQDKIDKAYDYDGGAFTGYSCGMLFNFGYLMTLFISFIYYFGIKLMISYKREISIELAFLMVLFLFIPVVSIFYTGFGLILFPLTFIFFVRILFTFKKYLL